MTRWSVVVPVKGTDLSKTRLAELPASVVERRRLALAFASDTVVALAAASLVGEILVVTGDPQSSAALTALGAHILADPGQGLNAAIAAGIIEARRRWPDVAVAAVTADLPALRTVDVDDALRAAAAVPASFVADFEGVGTTTITALPGVPLVPRFGIGSAAAHAAAGLVPLALPSSSSLRHDVDTPADLLAGAGSFGVHTGRALARGDDDRGAHLGGLASDPASTDDIIRP